MNWINNFVRPKIRGFLTTKREVPDNLWRTCPVTGQMVFHKDLEAHQFVFPGSDYHERVGAQDRLRLLFDDSVYAVVPGPAVPVDPLKFRDGRRYTERLREARASTEMDDAVLVGEGALDGRHCVAAVQDFRFMAGSLGMAAGEAIISGMLRAVEKKTPFILFAASGGARMQEGILSLMQMPRTTIAVQRLREAKLPYIVVLTNPTSGGVTASYAMLGDVHIAEPGALICFAGPRVIQQTIREQLPEGFQRSEYLVEHGMVDMVVHRHKLRETLSRLCRLLTSGRKPAEAGLAPVVTASNKPTADTARINGVEHKVAAAPETKAKSALPATAAATPASVTQSNEAKAPTDTAAKTSKAAAKENGMGPVGASTPPSAPPPTAKAAAAKGAPDPSGKSVDPSGPPAKN